jgi:hypothetical protein
MAQVDFFGPSNEVFVGANQTRTIIMGEDLGGLDVSPSYWSIFVTSGSSALFLQREWDLEVVRIRSVGVRSLGADNLRPRLHYTVRNNRTDQGAAFVRVAIRV